MTKIIGVRFRNAGKVYYFDPEDKTYRYDDHVIVETARGVEYGTVIITPIELPDDKVAQPLKGVLRMATEADTERETNNREREKEAYRICQDKIHEHKLDMKLISAEYTFDDSKLLFYFTADGRIDFRELVKDLAGIFKKRIELRQIGVRDETKILGGMGICGRPLCCHIYLSDFAPVSIKMAKEQNLSLNPAKISGTCGRLMCCLRNESETYAYLNKGMPGKGDQVTTPDGRHGEVYSVNILRQLVKVIVDTDNDEREMQEYPVADITFIPHSRRPKTQKPHKKGEEGDGRGELERKTPEQEKYQKAIKKALDAQQAGKEEHKSDPAQNETPASAGEHKKRRRRNRRKKKPETDGGTMDTVESRSVPAGSSSKGNVKEQSHTVSGTADQVQ